MSNSQEHGAYRTLLRDLAHSPYLVFPRVVHLETLALCPAACGFCPYPTLRRKGAKMEDALIDKILKDLEAIPRQLQFQLFPFKINEPFMDTRLMPILREINRRLPNAQLSLISNGHPLTEAKLLELAEIRNMLYLCISLNDHRPEVYTRLMELPWERMHDRLQLLHRLKAEGRLPFHILLSRVADGSADDQAFTAWGKAHYPLFKTDVYPRGNWIFQVDLEVPTEVPDVGCMRWFELSITATGEVALCCMDGQADWPLGNVREQHVLEVYNQPAYRRLRENSLSRLESKPCSSCTFM
ncbi:MAG: radical SAM/SPASM domain-containing protein [Candidatus Sericytochromatia bacterium]